MSGTLQETLRRVLALRAEGKAADAESLCDALLALDPENADGWHLTGLLRLDRGMNMSACDALAKAVALAPEMAGFHVNLATAFDRLGKPEKAIESLRRAIDLQEDLAEAHHNLGNALLASGRSEAAEAAFKRAVALRPGYAEALNNLGHIAQERSDPAAAIGFFRRALDAEPDYGPAWSNLCGALVDLGRTVDAIDAGRRAVLRSPDSAKAHYNLGNAFAAAPIPAEAAACYRRALQIEPRYADAFVNLGVAQINLGDCDQAIAALDHALALDANLAEAGWNKALALLLAGRLGEAWDLYEWRWRAVKGLSMPAIEQPLWDGGDGKGQTILIRCEQGYGDAMQMVRYLPSIRGRGWRAALECPPKLARLFADSGLADVVVPFGGERPAFDAWLPIMSLPRVCHTELATIPSVCPYLKAVPAARPGSGDDRLAVGLVWQGSLTNDRGWFRSSTLSDLAELKDLPGVALCSLQAQISAEERHLLERLSIPDLESGLSDFAETAAVVQSLDLVITVDTAMAHLAGALGKPVWTLLSAFPDWRWMLDRDDSPWYPTMRLFRQRRAGDWGPVVRDVASALQRLVEGGRSAVTQQRDRVASSGVGAKPATIPVMVPRLPETAALIPYLEEIDANRWYSNFGPLQRRFEGRLAGHYGLPKEAVVCVGSATAGLMLALAAVAGERGGVCILPSYSFVASAHAVLAAGLVPYFIDVDADSWAITPAGAAAAVQAAGRPVAAVLAVAPYGAPIDVAGWDEFAGASGIPVVIDAAAGFDTAAAGRAPVVVSLHATKLLAAGEGGFVISRDLSIINSIAARSNFGFLGERRANAVGFNGKLSEYGAAVGLASLDAWPEKRAAVWRVTELYRDALARLDNIRVSPGFGDGWVSSTCNVAFDRPIADAAIRALAQSGVDSRQWWNKGCHCEPAFAAYPRGDLSVTDDLGRRVLGLPFHESVGAVEIARVAAALASVADG